MTQTLVRVAADISTTLTTKLAVGATTGTLTSGVDGDGVQLPTGTYGFTVDRSSSSKEHFTATLTGAALTDIKTVTRGTGVGTAGLLREHRKGAEVIITDWVSLKRVINLLDGTTSFDSATPLGYDGTATISTANQFATKAYADAISLGGAPDATTVVGGTKGVSYISVAPVSAASPISIGQNDPVVPTQAENDALVGNNTDVAVGTGNKFVTQTGLQHNAEKYAADAGANDTYVITLSPVPTSYTNGMVVHFKANTANTGAATLNVNSLGAKTIVKGVNTTLDDSDILASQFITVIYDGTNFVLQNPVGTNPLYIVNAYKNGTGNSVGAAPTTQTITHGLGRTPKRIQIYAVSQSNFPSTSWSGGFSSGSWDSGSQSCVWSGQLNSTTTNQGVIAKAISIDYYDVSGGPIMRNFTGTIQNVGATTFELVGSAVTHSGGGVYYQWQVE